MICWLQFFSMLPNKLNLFYSFKDSLNSKSKVASIIKIKSTHVETRILFNVVTIHIEKIIFEITYGTTVALLIVHIGTA